MRQPPIALTPVPTATQPFDIAIESEARLRADPASGGWWVVGLARAAQEALANPHVRLVLRDAAGGEIARRTIELAIDPLPAERTWPYQEIFRPDSIPQTVEATLLGSSAGESSSPSVESRVVRSFLNAQGATMVLGRIHNPGREPVSIEAVRLLGRDPSGAPTEVVNAEPASSWLAPDGTMPFLGVLPVTDELDWEPFTMTLPAGPSPPTVEASEIEARQDDQGNPYMTASLINGESDPLWASVTAVASGGGVWLAAESIAVPLPLAPGEASPLSLRLPATSLGGVAATEVGWTLFVGSRPAESLSVPVASEVIGYSPVGSSLFLRIRLTGPEPAAISNPAALASLRSEDGRLVSAGWAAGPPILAPGESTEVTLALPLPPGFDLTLGQIDVRAGGVPVPQTAP